MIDEENVIELTNDWEYERVHFLKNLVMQAMAQEKDLEYVLDLGIKLWDKIVKKS